MPESDNLDKGAGTLLIVDDDAISRTILAALFEGDYRIVEAQDGAACLDAIEREGDAVVALLLDVMMPGIDGLEVLKRLAPTGFLARTPVFLITAERTAKVMEEAYRLGVMDVIVKPIIPFPLW